MELLKVSERLRYSNQFEYALHPMLTCFVTYEEKFNILSTWKTLKQKY